MTEEQFIELVEQNMNRHGLVQRGWVWKYTRRDSRSSKCYYQTKTLAFAPYLLLENTDVILGTVLHEIAHAISPERGHGRLFREKCREIGVPQNYIYSRSKKRRTLSAAAQKPRAVKKYNGWLAIMRELFG